MYVQYVCMYTRDGLLSLFFCPLRFEQIQFLPGHRGSVWGLDVCMDGAEIVTAGQDRSWRSWQRGEDLVFVEEERYTYSYIHTYIHAYIVYSEIHVSLCFSVHITY